MKFDGIALQIITDLKNGDFRLKQHAYERAIERSVGFDDIISVGRTARSCQFQMTRGTYKIVGSDADGDDLTVCCAYEGETLIITVF